MTDERREAAIEAAAKAMWENGPTTARPSWDSLTDRQREMGCHEWARGKDAYDAALGERPPEIDREALAAAMWEVIHGYGHKWGETAAKEKERYRKRASEVIKKLAATPPDPVALGGEARELRRALAIVKSAERVWRESPECPEVIPIWAASNALLMSIAAEEGTDIKHVLESLPPEPSNPPDPERSAAKRTPDEILRTIDALERRKREIEAEIDRLRSPDRSAEQGERPTAQAHTNGDCLPGCEYCAAEQGEREACELCRGERWIGGELERRRPCPACNS